MHIHATIKKWQTSQHEIGMVQFCSPKAALKSFPHSVTDEQLPIGMFEAELLCVDTRTGEVIALEHEVPGKIFCRCAASQEQWVAALKILEAHFKKCGEDDAYWEDEEAGLEVISRATEAAGGSEYEAIYHSLVGF